MFSVWSACQVGDAHTHNEGLAPGEARGDRPWTLSACGSGLLKTEGAIFSQRVAIILGKHKRRVLDSWGHVIGKLWKINHINSTRGPVLVLLSVEVNILEAEITSAILSANEIKEVNSHLIKVLNVSHSRFTKVSSCDVYPASYLFSCK